MLQSLVAWVLRTYVGEYVENLNTDQLSIGCGTLDLHNLPLKKTALKGLELPLEVKSGIIGHLKLSVPLRGPKSEPWIVNINKLYLVVGPCQHSEYNEEEKDREKARKRKQLDALEAQWLAARNENAGSYWSGSWWPSLHSSFSAIVENLELVINDVQFRYEDATTEESLPFAFGITIEKLSAQSTNEEWNPEETIQNERTIKYKLIELQNMAIYWDTDVTLVGDLPSRDLEKHQYILKPTSAQAKMERNASALPLRSPQKPRFVVDVRVEKIPLSLEKTQYKMLLALMDRFERHFRQRRYLKWRPKNPIKNNAREWWQFSITCILQSIKEKNMHQTWSFAVKRAHDIVKYVNIYSQHLKSVKVGPTVKEEQAKIEEELTFEEAVLLRSIAKTRVEDELSQNEGPDKATSRFATRGETGGWRGWLKGWYSWYGTDTTDGPSAEPPITKEEEEFLDELADPHLNESIFNRDQVFAHLNFRLDAGSFTLVNTKHSNTTVLPGVKVKFSDLKWDSKMRPRSKKWEFSMTLGALFLRDKLTKGTLFPDLVCPEGLQSQRVSQTKNQRVTLSGLQDMREPVFEMRFESLAPTDKVSYRLSVTTQPLYVVYNPMVLDHIAEFFSHASMKGTQALHIERQLREVSRVKYEELKNQTTAELVQTLDAMMKGSDVVQSKRWDIRLDISAPRFLLPGSYHNKEAAVVLIDFGHLSFGNTQSLNRTEMEDDCFVTPPSTPPSEQDECLSITDSTDALENEISTESLVDVMYERYTLDLSDIQMMVCNAKDNWSELASKTFMKSDLGVHVVEKFTIAIQMERRLLFTADPQYPAVTLSAKLPSLELHINEHKLQALTRCIKQLNKPKASTPSTQMPQERIVTSSSPLPPKEKMDGSATIPDMAKESPTRRSTKSAVDTTLEDKTKELMEESRMLVVQFSIDKVTLGVRSMGRLIAELQVLGVKANYMKRPYDSTTSFVVHGVHLVDGKQSFGPDYEFLFSSCKPHLPRSSSDNNSNSQRSKRSLIESVSSEATAVIEEEDLITFEYKHSDADGPSTKTADGNELNLVTFQFNTVNVIANQETLAALVQFFNNAFPSGDSGAGNGDLPMVEEEEPIMDTYQPHTDGQLPNVTKVTASCRSISVLVIRSIKLDEDKTVRKVAEVSVSEVQLDAALGVSKRIEGSLGALRVDDLTPEGSRHHSVYTCGRVCTGDLSARNSPSGCKALTFTLLIPKKGKQCPNVILEMPTDRNMDIAEIMRNIQLNVHIASAQYTHTHRFLSELLLSAGDYAKYAAQFGESLRQTVSNVAMGLVSKKRALAEGLDCISSTADKEKSLESRQDSSLFKSDIDDLQDSCDFVDNVPVKPNRRVYICVTVDSPVVQIPKSSSSTEMLVADLGKITIRNTHLMEVVEEESDTGHLTGVEHDVDRVFVEIKDMSLYCLTKETGGSRKTSSLYIYISNAKSCSGRKIRQSQKFRRMHILHKTAFSLSIDRRSESVGSLEMTLKLKKPTIYISAKVATPLKLELCTHSYHQLLDTIDNIGGSKETVPVPPPAGMQTLSAVASPSSQLPSTHSSSSSASNLEASIPEKVMPEKHIPFVPNVTFSGNADSKIPDKPDAEFETESEDPTPIQAIFEMPLCSIKLCGELNKVDHDFVDILFYDFKLCYDHTQPTRTLFDISLGGLVVEDLLQEPKSPYRYLIASSAHRHCYLRERSDSSKDIRTSNTVTTEKKGNNLVRIGLLLVDKRDDEFTAKYNSINRSINVDFDSLEANLNLQTWVIVMEFFGIGVPQPPTASQPSSSNTTQPHQLSDAASEKVQPNLSRTEGTKETESEGINTYVKFQASALTLTLSKTNYPLAKVKAYGLFTQISMKDGNVAAKGGLTSMSVTDMSPHGTLYREKFRTFGDEALSFDFFKYGAPDPDLLRKNDMSLTLRMSSVQYVHTKRFQTELVVFFQHYLQLQEVLGRMRAASEGNKVSWVFERGTRVELDIKAGNPVILVPRSAESSHMLVADLGNLTVTNGFLWEGSPGTVAYCKNRQRAQSKTDSGLTCPHHICLLDSMHIELVDMDLFTATRVNNNNHQATLEVSYRSQGLKLLKEKCRLNLTVERNLDWAFSRAVPDFNFSGRLSSVCASLDYSQYCFILGMLGENFGEPLEEFERPSSAIQDPLEKPQEAKEVWTSQRMSIDLVDVSLELLPIQLFEHPEEDTDHTQLPSLARIDFIKSKFEFETFSDWSKTIDLVSEKVIFRDTRHKDLDDSDSCIFTEVLLPRRSSNTAQAQEDFLQFMVHYRDDTSETLLRFVFNQTRIMMIIDYLLDTYNFIMCRMFKPSTDLGGSTDQEQPMDATEVSSPSKAYEKPPPSASSVATTCEVPAQPKKKFEMKVSISGTDLVVLENVNSEDTHAFVLKITAALAWRPHLQGQKWLSCSVESLEMFSCVLCWEEETALSIIDPATELVELNIAEEQLPNLEVDLQGPLNLRVSYNDYKLYLRIMESVSKQINKAIKSEDSSNEIPDHDFDTMTVKRLQELRFKESDCIKAVQATSGHLEASATWLLENATPVIQTQSPQQQNSAKGWQFAGFEVRADTVCVCLIDDCGDSDVPLIELISQDLYFRHDLQSTGAGKAQCTLIAQYYNRNVSDWEPFVDPWKCQLRWQKKRKTTTSSPKFHAKLSAPDRLDVTVTATLINLIKHTSASWSEDYCRSEPSPLSSPTSRPESSASLWSIGPECPRRRSPFVPFLLRNQTGCIVWFKTVTATPSKVIVESTGQALPGLPGSDSRRMSEWKRVSSGGEEPFEFTSAEKLRHKGTHELKIHQLIVQVKGWESLSPVSVDRVGTFFRQARPQREDSSAVVSNLQPARVVFDINQEGRARKVVTVRSALMINNKMDLPLEIKLRGSTSLQEFSSLPVLAPDSSVSIPLQCTSWQLYLRPSGVGVEFCSQPIEWRSVLKSHTTMDSERECFPVSSAGEAGRKFRFCVAVKREGYPEDVPIVEGSQENGLNVMPQPAHTLTITCPVMLVNLLPCDLSYQVKGTPAEGYIKAGKSVHLYTADPEKALDLSISIEKFRYSDIIRVSRRLSKKEHPIIHVELQDTKRRPLKVNVKVSVRPGGSLRVSIYAPYWIINNTGIPLVFKQAAVSHEMAGQFDEHELKRSLTPLLFSSSKRCQMRIGQGYHEGSGKPDWSESFSLDKPTSRQLIKQRGTHITRVYDITIDVQFGQGRYCDTRIVTIAPRYQLENRIQHTLAFSQRHLVRYQKVPSESALTVQSGARGFFNWTRTDLDQLLCIRLKDVSHCMWSGGFTIDREDSFHVSMRSLDGSSLFVRVEVMLKGAIFHVLFTDASQLPPPYRIDNLSEMPITFYQCGTEDRLRTILQPKQSVPYSWDEPALLPALFVGVMERGSYTCKRFNMQDLGEVGRLNYYNPIYIVFTHTFTSVDGQICGSVHLRPATAANESSLDMRELVLDVPEGTAVQLRRKEPYKRSQLWHLTDGGILRHEGSSQPSTLVLDINSLGPPSFDEYLRLVLRKRCPGRLRSQTWTFTEDNRMKCDLGLYVQPRGGAKGLNHGEDAVVGPANITKDDQIPIEQCISTCKLRPGSGCLEVKILADGPTRVLEITDCLQRSEYADKVEEKGNMHEATVSSLHTKGDSLAVEVQARLPGGIGVSVINSVPEELVFINLEQIKVDYLRTSKLETLEGSIGRIQIDNQIFPSKLPVLLHPSLPEKETTEETIMSQKQPTLHVSVSKQPSSFSNVEIFKKLKVSLCKMTLQMEEQLLLKLLQFVGYVQQDDDVADSNQELEECLYTAQRPTLPSSSGLSKRYYFEHIQLNSTQIRLSFSSACWLPEDLQSLRNSLPSVIRRLFLVNVEEATIDLEQFSRSHMSGTMSFHKDSIRRHYTDETLSQCLVIFGSFDFLGNPLGLIKDVASGVEGLKRGNVKGLFMNVGHGLSNTLAKITGSGANGLSFVTRDSKFQKQRDATRAERFSSSEDHLKAGVNGLKLGLTGGLTGIITQPFEGADNDGFLGFIKGLGKGIVGAVAKPTAGVLDFLSGATAAVRSKARCSSRYFPPQQTRLRRNCFGPGGAIPRFAAAHAEGQEIMLKLNEGNFNEKFVLAESVRRDKEDGLTAIVTTEGVYFVCTRGALSPDHEAIVRLVHFSDLNVCQPFSIDGNDYIELVMKANNGSVPTQVHRCDELTVAQRVAGKVTYAKELYDEVQQTVKVASKEPTSQCSY